MWSERRRHEGDGARRHDADEVVLIRALFAALVVVAGCPDAPPSDAGHVCARIDPYPPPYPEGVALTVRHESGPAVAPFATCSGFTSSLGADFCGGETWVGGWTGEGGYALANDTPQLATYGYAMEYRGDVGRLCRFFGDELGDEHGCPRRDVRCASSGEIVIRPGGGSLVADFEGGGHVEAAWRLPLPADAAIGAPDAGTP